LSGAVYSSQLSEENQFQLSYFINDAQQGIVFEAMFAESAPELSPSGFTNNQFQFQVVGMSGTNHIVQAATNLSAQDCLSFSTNAAPFTFTDTNAASFTQRFYRVVMQ
jgi:hypothetical protein